MTVTADRETASPGFKSIGTRPIRPDGFEKVTGRAKFGADLRLPGMLEGAIVRSPHAHARIRSIDTTAAAAMPGVKAIVTGADFPEPSGKPDDQSLQRNIIARDTAYYEGHVVAAVAASSRREARAAAAAIVVDYEVLPHVLTVDEAMAPGAVRAPRLADHRGRRPGADGAVQRRRPHGAGAGRPRAGLRRGRRRRRARVHDQDGPPGLHRTARRHRGHDPERALDDLVHVAGPALDAGHDGHRAGLGAVAAEGHPLRDRRRFRRQAGDLPRAARRGPLAEGRPAGAAGHGPRRRVPGHRADLGDPHRRSRSAPGATARSPRPRCGSPTRREPSPVRASAPAR